MSNRTTNIPECHVTVVLPATSGRYILTGWRSHNTYARFLIEHDGSKHGDGCDVLVDGSWRDAYLFLAPIVGVANVSDVLRSALPVGDA